jgi:hypothetical protein
MLVGIILNTSTHSLLSRMLSHVLVVEGSLPLLRLGLDVRTFLIR